MPMARIFQCFVVACLLIMAGSNKVFTPSCKTREVNGPRKDCLYLCGDLFMVIYRDLCNSRRKRESYLNEGKLSWVNDESNNFNSL